MMPIAVGPPMMGAVLEPSVLPMESLIGALLDGGQGHVARESHSMDEDVGPDGKKHLYEVVTRCTDGDCHTSRRQVDTDTPPAKMQGGGDEKEHATPPLQMHDNASGMGPVNIGALVMEPVALPLLPGLGSVLDNLLDDGPIDIPSAVQRVRLRASPDLAGRLAAPLDHITRPDGTEVIEGDLPKGLDKAGLLVEQRGDVVLIRHILNHTMDGKGSIGIEQHIRLGFQPVRKEKAKYNPATGHFAMEFARPKNADFDPHVEVQFETPDADKENSHKNATPQGASSDASKGSQAAKSQGAMDSKHNKTDAQGSHVSMLQLGKPMAKPDLIFEVGDEL